MIVKAPGEPTVYHMGDLTFHRDIETIKSRLMRASPPFTGFIEAAVARSEREREAKAAHLA